MVTADRQTAGRGRRGHPWVSPPGNVFVSVLLRPEPALRVSLLPLTAGLAVADAVAEAGVLAELKWPNDVLVGGLKVAGVLAEASSSGPQLEWVVVGIGVNLALDAAGVGLPEATSLSAAAGRGLDALPVAAAVLVRMSGWYHALAHDPAAVLAAWKARAVPWWGSAVEVRAGEEGVRGILKDVSGDGALLLEVEGVTRAFLAGEVRRVRIAGER